MSDWSDGYVTNTEYTTHFYPFLSPAAQNFALVLSGHAPTDLNGGFTYCELGCGHGYTTALLSSVYPEGKFWGVDFNPAHVAGANKLKQAAGLSNMEFLERSFAELIQMPDLPSFDFITLHGVWSWISAENRRAITSFIYAKLKPGGVVYNSYNAMPGWASIAPLRQLMVETQRHKTEIDAAAVDAAIAVAKRMQEMNAAYFQATPAAKGNLEQIGKASRNYLLHEYFNRDWEPFYFSTVAADLRPAKLTYACSNDVVEQLEQVCLTADAQTLLKEISDPVARETIRDYFRNTRFRRDLFTRGARKLNQQERANAMRSTRVVLASASAEFPMQVNVPVGSVKLPEEPCKAIVRMLAEGSRTIGELLDVPEINSHGAQKVFQLMMLMVTRGIIQSALPKGSDKARREAASRFNRAVMMRPAGLESQALASPELGNGSIVPRVDQFILAFADNKGHVSAERLLKEANARGVKMHQQATDGNAAAQVNTVEGIQAVLDEFAKGRLLAYRRLGIVG